MEHEDENEILIKDLELALEHHQEKSHLYKLLHKIIKILTAKIKQAKKKQLIKNLKV